MKASEAYRKLYAETPVPLVTVRDDGRIVDANAAFCEAARIRIEELVGSPFVDQLVAQDRGASRVYLRQSLEKGLAEWAVSLIGGPSVRWKVRSVAFVDQVAILTLWTPPTKDVPQSLVPALASLMRRVPGQAVVLLSEDLWVLGSWGMPALGAGDDASVLGRHLAKVVDFADGGLSDLSSALATELEWSGRLGVAPESGERGTSCLAHLIPARVVGGGRQGAGFLVLRRSAEAGGSGSEPQRAGRLAQVGAFSVHLVEWLGARARDLAKADPGTAEPERLSLELEALDRRLRDFTEGARSEGRAVVREVVQTLESRWRPYLSDQGIGLEIELPDDVAEVLLEVSGEVAAGVLDELVENARVAVGEEAERLVAVRAAGADSGVSIRVEDSGLGVSRAHRDALFEPFHSRWSGRLGLGLSVARAQLELRGGRLALVESTGPGAAFEAVFPIAGSEATDDVPPASVDALRVPSLADRTVLLVEESEDTRSALARILETAGMTVRPAWSGRSALSELTQRGPTDAVVCGFSEESIALRFLSELREAFPDLATRAVVITDAASPEQRRDQQSRMECPVLARPIVVQRLLSRLEAVIQGG